MTLGNPSDTRLALLEGALKKTIRIFNQIPNTSINHDLFDNTYQFVSYLEYVVLQK